MEFEQAFNLWRGNISGKEITGSSGTSLEKLAQQRLQNKNQSYSAYLAYVWAARGYVQEGNKPKFFHCLHKASALAEKTNRNSHETLKLLASNPQLTWNKALNDKNHTFGHGTTV